MDLKKHSLNEIIQYSIYAHRNNLDSVIIDYVGLKKTMQCHVFNESSQSYNNLTYKVYNNKLTIFDEKIGKYILTYDYTPLTRVEYINTLNYNIQIVKNKIKYKRYYLNNFEIYNKNNKVNIAKKDGSFEINYNFHKNGCKVLSFIVSKKFAHVDNISYFRYEEKYNSKGKCTESFFSFITKDYKSTNIHITSNNGKNIKLNLYKGAYNFNIDLTHTDNAGIDSIFNYSNLYHIDMQIDNEGHAELEKSFKVLYEIFKLYSTEHSLLRNAYNKLCNTDIIMEQK